MEVFPKFTYKVRNIEGNAISICTVSLPTIRNSRTHMYIQVNHAGMETQCRNREKVDAISCLTHLSQSLSGLEFD